jgi:DNA-binding response OmpR family regulator
VSSQPQSNVQEKPLVLVVDDSVELGTIVRVLGRRAGHEVILCPDAAAGWRALQERLPNLILLDVNLPGMSGLELCRMIRASNDLSHLPLALFSHWQMPHDIVAGLEAGVDFLVNKALVTQPEAWQARLGEILSWIHGRRWERLVSWLENRNLPELSDHWVDDLNRALRHPSLQLLRPQILRFLLLRSLRQAASSPVGAVEVESWLTADDALLARNRFSPFQGPAERRLGMEGVILMVVTLTELTWCLLGTEATADFRTAIALVVPGLEEFLAY